MVQKIQTIIEKLENFAPLETQEEWDNSGWQINLGNQDTSKILLTTTVTQNTIDDAVKNKCDLIISHHPLLFSPIKKITNPLIIKTVQNNIQIYSMHTNFDKAKGGTSEIIANQYGIYDFQKLNDFVITSKLNKEIAIKELVKQTKNIFNLDNLKVFNYAREKMIKNIAFCAGSGGEFINTVEYNNIDLYITSDIKYHQIQNLFGNLCVFDVGHLESEKISLSTIKNIIQSEDIEVLIEKETSNAQIL